MSLDGKYLLEVRGPFGETEREDIRKAFGERFPVIHDADLAYGTLFFETKHTHDDAVASFAKEIGAVCALACDENQGPWRIIYSEQ